MANEKGDNSKKTSQLSADVQENPSIHYHGSSSEYEDSPKQGRFDLQKRVARKQQSQKKSFDKHTKEKGIPSSRNCVDFQQPKWIQGMIVKKTGPVSYEVEMQQGISW